MMNIIFIWYFSVGGNSTTSATGAGVALVSSKAEGKLRDKVAALFSATNDNRSVDDIRRQREEEMQLLGQRFHKNKAIAVLASSGKGEVQKQTMKTPPPPPPPLPSTSYGGNLYAQLNKRRSCKILDNISSPSPLFFLSLRVILRI